VFYLEKALKMRKGETITGEVSFEQYQRDLNVKFFYELESHVGNGTNGFKVANGKKATGGFGVYKVYVSLADLFIFSGFSKALLTLLEKGMRWNDFLLHKYSLSIHGVTYFKVVYLEM